jgi:4-hydroxybenzoate polyprenyltransferase
MFLPLIGLEVGILMMFYEYIFVNLHFNYSESIPLWTYFAQISMVLSAYGYDRWLDVKMEDTDNEELIEYINNNFYYVKGTITISFLLSIVSLFQNEHTRFLIIPFMLSVLYYRDFKKTFPLLKPFFICTLLVTSSVIFPSIVIENNLNIFSDLNALIPPFANLYSSSNYLDVIDYNIDKLNNINTLAVLYGNNTALTASFMANTISTISHINHPNFHHNPINYLFQAQNIFTGVSIINKNPIDYRKNNKNNKNNDNSPNMLINNSRFNFKPKCCYNRLITPSFCKMCKFTPRLLV